MSGALNEKQALNMLNIKDFSQLTKDHVFSLASMLDEMKPKAAKNMLTHFPNFNIAVKQVLGELTEALDRARETNGSVVEEFYDSCSSMIRSLRSRIVNSGSSFEERDDIMRRLVEISRTIAGKDRISGGYAGTTVGEMAARDVGIAALDAIFDLLLP